jgi:hypothetical protein
VVVGKLETTRLLVKNRHFTGNPQPGVLVERRIRGRTHGEDCDSTLLDCELFCCSELFPDAENSIPETGASGECLANIGARSTAQL